MRSKCVTHQVGIKTNLYQNNTRMFERTNKENTNKLWKNRTLIIITCSIISWNHE